MIAAENGAGRRPRAVVSKGCLSELAALLGVALAKDAAEVAAVFATDLIDAFLAAAVDHAQGHAYRGIVLQGDVAGVATTWAQLLRLSLDTRGHVRRDGGGEAPRYAASLSQDENRRRRGARK